MLKNLMLFVPLVVALSANASAALTFSLSNINDLPGSFGNMLILASTSVSGGENISITSITIDYSSGGNDASTITTTPFANVGSLSVPQLPTTNAIGFVSYSIMPTATLGDNDTFTVMVTGNIVSSGANTPFSQTSTRGSVTAVPEPSVLGLLTVGRLVSFDVIAEKIHSDNRAANGDEMSPFFVPACRVASGIQELPQPVAFGSLLSLCAVSVATVVSSD